MMIFLLARIFKGMNDDEYHPPSVDFKRIEQDDENFPLSEDF